MRSRSPFAVALAALLAAPAVASSAPPRKSSPTRSAPAAAAPAAAPASKQLTIGGVVGYELGDLDGFMLRLDAEMPIQPLTPQVNLSGVGSVGYTRYGMDDGGMSATWNVFKVIPAARFSMPAAPQLTLYGDAGLGLYYASWSTELTTFTGGKLKTDGSTTGFLMRFGVGGLYQVNPQTKLSAEIGLTPYFGDAETTNWTLGIGAMFAL